MPKPTPPRKAPRREDALSRERIVAAAIELLDRDGEEGLTFRALATHLATGAGAIYWHVTNKQELLAAATDEIVGRALGEIRTSTKPARALHAIALGVFEAVEAHPWLGGQLSRAPSERGTMQIFEKLGQQVQALGARGAIRLTATSALLTYLVGVSVQNAAAHTFARQNVDPAMGRDAYLESVADQWKTLDEASYPFTRSVAAHLPGHDDRAELLAGIDLIVAGIVARG